MEVTVTIKKKLDAKYLKASCGVRYWEDAKVNGIVDDDGALIPCRRGKVWEPVIDLYTGIVENWPQGTTASIHYKVCDDGIYSLLDRDMEEIVSIDGYVPKIMYPGGNGFGDYVIMEIDVTGKIHNWEPTLSQFEE